MSDLPGFLMPIMPLCTCNDNDDNDDYTSDDTSYYNSNNVRTRVCVILAVLAIILLIILFSTVIYCYLLPGPPQMLEFQVNSLEVTSMNVYNVSNDYYSIMRNQKHIMAGLDFNVTLKTKDEVSLYYFNPMQVSLEYHHDEFLVSTLLEPFRLLGDHANLQFGMQIKDDARLQNKTVDSISQDLRGRNVLQFALKAQGQFLRWHGHGYPHECSISVVCDDMKVRFLPASNLTTGSLIVSPLLCKCKSDCP